MVANSEFRSDLSYRLNGYTILLPPLRDRRDDIPALTAYYLERFTDEIGKTISAVAPETMERLEHYSWPGNIRELQTVLKHSLLHTIGPVLLPDFLPPELREAAQTAAAPHRAAANGVAAEPAAASSLSPGSQSTAFRDFIASQLRDGTTSLYAECLDRMESMLLADVLSHTKGNQSRAATLLGITRGCLRSKLRAHGITLKTLLYPCAIHRLLWLGTLSSG